DAAFEQLERPVDPLDLLLVELADRLAAARLPEQPVSRDTAAYPRRIRPGEQHAHAATGRTTMKAISSKSSSPATSPISAVVGPALNRLSMSRPSFSSIIERTASLSRSEYFSIRRPSSVSSLNGRYSAGSGSVRFLAAPRSRSSACLGSV